MRLEDLLLLKAKGRPTGRLDVPQTCVAAYYDDLRAAGLVDLDSLLPEFLRMLHEDPLRYVGQDPEEDCDGVVSEIREEFTHILWDEMQDSAEVDWRICHALPIANKFMVGDPDQAVYSFRGGRVDMMMNEAVAPGVEVIKLEENFRSHSEICAAANKLIEHNEGRIAKRTISVKGEGGWVESLRPSMNEGEEIARVASKVKELLETAVLRFLPSDIAILARTNALCRAYERTLEACHIPVAKRAETTMPKDWPLARALVELMANPSNDTLAYFALVQLYTRDGLTPLAARKEAHTKRRAAEHVGLSLNEFAKICLIHDVGVLFALYKITAETCMLVTERITQLPAGATMLDLALAMNGRAEEKAEEGEGVTVCTMHAAKGREFDVVFIIGAEEEITPGGRKDANIEEERRLFYVAATRARERLYVAWSGSRVQPFGRKEIVPHRPSRFVKEMGL
jgi:DNA helicase II / ATP-dependent DNA helicase PcrA